MRGLTLQVVNLADMISKQFKTRIWLAQVVRSSIVGTQVDDCDGHYTQHGELTTNKALTSRARAEQRCYIIMLALY